MPKRIELIGQRFGMLTVIGENGRGKSGNIRWLCQCDCGATTTARGSFLINRQAYSCGCKNRPGSLRKKQNGKGSDEHRIWKLIKRRCYNKNSKEYRFYGGRGIFVSPLWKDDFQAFLRHVGQRPSKEHSIDRINNDGNYEPGNVRWATTFEQANNTRANHRITIDGVTKTLTEWCRELGILQPTVSQRIKCGVDARTALFTPPQKPYAFKRNNVVGISIEKKP